MGYYRISHPCVTKHQNRNLRQKYNQNLKRVKLQKSCLTGNHVCSRFRVRIIFRVTKNVKINLPPSLSVSSSSSCDCVVSSCASDTFIYSKILSIHKNSCLIWTRIRPATIQAEPIKDFEMVHMIWTISDGDSIMESIQWTPAIRV